MASYIGPPQSGSVRADTYSRNRYGSYIRNRSVPVNPSTSLQTIARMRFTTNSQAWRGLTDAERAAWNAYAETHPIVSPLGEFKYLTGSSMFVKIRCQRQANSIPGGTTPPAEPAFVTSGLSLVATAGTPALTVSGTDQPSGYKALIRASPPLSAGRSFPPSQPVMQSVAADTWATPISILSAYTGRYGVLVAGQKIIIDAQLCSDEGTYGARIRQSIVVAA